MSVNNRPICAMVIALAFIFSSCSQPKYLVKGLTLPPGSTEVSYEDDSDAGSKLPFPIPGVGQVTKTVTVNFDYSGNWDNVVAHIDKCMGNVGYASLSSQLDDIPLVGESAKKMADANKMMRFYNKEGGKFGVMLINNNWLGDSTGMPGINLAGSDYSLTVVESEVDE